MLESEAFHTGSLLQICNLRSLNLFRLTIPPYSSLDICPNLSKQVHCSVMLQRENVNKCPSSLLWALNRSPFYVLVLFSYGIFRQNLNIFLSIDFHRMSSFRILCVNLGQDREILLLKVECPTCICLFSYLSKHFHV